MGASTIDSDNPSMTCLVRKGVKALSLRSPFTGLVLLEASDNVLQRGRTQEILLLEAEFFTFHHLTRRKGTEVEEREREINKGQESRREKEGEYGQRM